MFVLYDASALQTESSRGRGIGRFADSLLAGVRQARPDWDVRLLVHDYLPPPDANARAGLRCHTFTPPLRIDPGNRTANERYLGDWVAALKPDWVIHPSPFEHLALGPRYTAHRPRVGMLMHDLIPLVFAHQYYLFDPASEWYAERLREVVKADLLFANSECTADDCRRMFGPGCPPVAVVRGGADETFRLIPDREFGPAERTIRAKLGLAKPFVLYLGGFDPRKNMSGAVAGYAALPAEVRAGVDLVLPGKFPPAGRAELERDVERYGVTGQVHMPGFVTDAELQTLYQACRVFFFPSHYEGLGLPVVEAMRHGAPVVVADNSALPEYAGDLSWYCDPTSPESMARALAACLAEPREARLADRVRFAGQFNWADTADRLVQAVEDFEPAEVAPRRKRVAWVAPAPPAATGVADYAAEVAGLLADRFEIEWVYDPAGPPPDLATTRTYPAVPVDDADARHAADPFDLFVYHVGNNRAHAFMLPLMQRHPGLVVVHDLHLGGLYRSAAGRGVWPGEWRDELWHNGEWHLAGLVDGAPLHPDLASALSRMDRRVLDLAAAVVVHSASAWQQVRRTADAPAAVVPHLAAPPAVGTRAAERTRLGLPADRFVVATLGQVGPSKRVPALLRAVADLPADVRDRTLVVVVGPVHPSDRKDILYLAAEYGIAGRVEVRGRVPLADLTAYAVAADVCVQLRYPCNGETSGALTRALAAGAACVTSDVPAMAEVPNGVTVKVRSPHRDVADLTRALTRLARNPAERDRLGEAARRHMAESQGAAATAARYAAAIEETVAALEAADGHWLADTVNSLADAYSPIPPGLFGQWARLRERVLRPTAAPAEPVPELPAVPAEPEPGRQAA